MVTLIVLTSIVLVLITLLVVTFGIPALLIAIVFVDLLVFISFVRLVSKLFKK